MNGIRKISQDLRPGEELIHPIFLTIIENKGDETVSAALPHLVDNKLHFLKIMDKEEKKLKQLISYAEKPYTSFPSKLILNLKKINNLVDIENMLNSNIFKNELEFKYYFNIFIRLNLSSFSKIQNKLLIDFLIKYFKNKSTSLNFNKMDKIIKKWKEKSKEQDFEYKFIEYVEKKIKK